LNAFNISVDSRAALRDILNVFKSHAPPTGKGEETRAAIYETALRLFREKGFDATTMRDIAAGAGVAAGAAYYYFPGKESIIHAYYERVQADHDAEVTRQLEAAPRSDLRQRLRIAFHSKLDILQNDRRLLGIVFRYSGEPGHPLSCLGPSTSHLRRGSIEVFGRALAGQSLPPDLAQLLPVALWALHMGVLILFIYDGSARQQRTRMLVEGAIDLAVRLLALAKTPLLKPVRMKVTNLLRSADLLPEFDLTVTGVRHG
jgi:AcrR family transcriptional regulator